MRTNSYYVFNSKCFKANVQNGMDKQGWLVYSEVEKKQPE